MPVLGDLDPRRYWNCFRWRLQRPSEARSDILSKSQNRFILLRFGESGSGENDRK